MDIDDTETGDIFFTSQADTEDDNNTGSETADFIRRSTPASYPASPQDDSQIADLDYIETGDVASMTQTDAGGGHNTDLEIVSLVCCSTSTPHLTSPQGNDRIMDLDPDDRETGDVFFMSQADVEDESDAGFGMVSFIDRSTPAPISSLSRMTASSWIPTTQGLGTLLSPHRRMRTTGAARKLSL